MTRSGLLADADLRLTVVSPPDEEPVTVDEIKRQARIDDTSDAAVNQTQDDDIETLIRVVRESVEAYQRRALITQTLSIQLDDFPDSDDAAIVLPRPPLQSVTSIVYLDANGVSQTLAAANYRVDTASQPGEVSLAYGQTWPVVRDVHHAVTVTYVAGYGSSWDNVPALTRHAIKMMCVSLYDHREALSDQTRGNVVELAGPVNVRRLLNFERVMLV